MFDVPVGDDDRALDVFHHPYAYAARRRHGTSESFPTAADAALPA